MSPAPKVVPVAGLSNRQFLERYAAPGRIGLAGGSSWIDRRIRRAERRLRPDESWSPWSHAFLFQGRRADGKHWVVEADIDLAKAQFRNGVQENRIDRFFDEEQVPALAVLDFGLTRAAARAVVSRALDLAAEHVRYSYAGIVGTWLAMRRRRLSAPNRLHGARRAFCSSMVQLLFAPEGVRFAPGVDDHHVTPEHIAQTGVPHTRWVLERPEVRTA